MDTGSRSQTLRLKIDRSLSERHCVRRHRRVSIMQLTNVVCSASLNCPVDLRALCLALTNVRYDPARFPGLIWQHRTIGGNCLVFSNGKLHCSGRATRFREGIQRLRRYARVLQNLGIPIMLTDAKVMTASAFHILSAPLNWTLFINEKQLVYEPELFPTVNFSQEGVTFSCFSNGKVIITGIKTETDIDEVVYPTLIELELYTHQT